MKKRRKKNSSNNTTLAFDSGMKTALLTVVLPNSKMFSPRLPFFN
jgi:hypothetical protein